MKLSWELWIPPSTRRIAYRPQQVSIRKSRAARNRNQSSKDNSGNIVGLFFILSEQILRLVLANVKYLHLSIPQKPDLGYSLYLITCTFISMAANSLLTREDSRMHPVPSCSLRLCHDIQHHSIEFICAWAIQHPSTHNLCMHLTSGSCISAFEIAMAGSPVSIHHRRLGSTARYRHLT